jgi:uncharacterized membrane protein YgaE (UPF0421/DUF939 family)
MKEESWASFVFSAKAAVAAVTGYGIMIALHWPGAAWAAVSALLVIQPSLHPSWQASLLRCQANLLGALIGVGLVQTIGANFLSLGLGVLLTGLICHYTRLDEGLRSAYVAVVIIVLTVDSNAWTASVDRIIAVLIGCLSAILISVLFDRVFARAMERLQKYVPGRTDTE